MSTTLASMNGDNALEIMGNIGYLLHQLDRQAFDGKKGLRDEYHDKAMRGDYEHVCQVTEDYAIKYLQQTLRAREGDLTGLDGDDDFDRSGEPDVCDHCGVPTRPTQERECDECTNRILGL